jgi:hypothetical protein
LILPRLGSSSSWEEEWVEILEIWVLNESGVERTWTPRFAIRIPEDCHLIQLREDGLVVLTDEEQCLVLYDQRTEERRNLQIYEAGISQLVSYTESLILINGSGNVLGQQATS